MSVLLEEKVHDPYFQVTAYTTQPTAVPTIEPTVYQYFRIQHKGLTGVENELEFRVSNSWLHNLGAVPNDVRFYRFEQGAWKEYTPTPLYDDTQFFNFKVALPGFSFFVIRVDQTESIEEVVEIVENETVENVTPVQIPPEIFEVPEVEFNDSTEINAIESVEETVSYEEAEKNISWWVLVVVLALLIIAAGVWYYVSQHSQEPTPHETKQTFNKDDPFYKLQQYISQALDKGHSSEAIREQLLAVGWDEIVIDEEIQNVMNKRIQ